MLKEYKTYAGDYSGAYFEMQLVRGDFYRKLLKITGKIMTTIVI
jgi:hypothetical protein